MTGPASAGEGGLAGSGASAGGAGQSVAGSVVLGDVIQIRDVAGDVTVSVHRPGYRVEAFPAVAAGVGVERARAQPSRLLPARFEIVPFAGRAGVVAELSGWLAVSEPVAVRLVHGPGGQGKTRLAAHFARHHAAGWAVWQVRQTSALTAPAQIPVPDAAAGLLVVVDYAHRWPPSLLQALVTDLHALAGRLAAVACVIPGPGGGVLVGQP